MNIFLDPRNKKPSLTYTYALVSFVIIIVLILFYLFIGIIYLIENSEKFIILMEKLLNLMDLILVNLISSFGLYQVREFRRVKYEGGMKDAEWKYFKEFNS